MDNNEHAFKGERTFKGEAIKDFTEMLKNADLNINLARDIRTGIESFGGISKLLAGEIDKATQKILNKENYKDYMLIKDTLHQFLDLGLSLGAFSVAAVLNVGKDVSKQAFSKSGTHKDKSEKRAVISRGSTVTLPFTIENDSDNLIENICFTATPLVSEQGDVIGASNISFNPPSLTVFPNDSENQHVVLAVPQDTASGIYRGTVAVENYTDFKLPFEIEVV